MQFLTCYENHFATITKQKDIVEVTFCSLEGKAKLDLYCYADVKWKGLIRKTPFLYTTEMPIIIEAHDTTTNERFVVFDEAVHGYNALLCDDYTGVDLTKRFPLKKLISVDKLIVVLHYGINYEEEKSDYEFDKKGKVKTDKGTTLDWEYLKSNGIDWISISYIDEKNKLKKILDFELA